MNWTDTSALTLTTFSMCSSGGMNTRAPIPDCHVWCLTTSPSLVSFFIKECTSVLLNKGLVATSVDVERVFSQGRLLLSHVRSRLSVQSTRALMCLGIWSKMGYVKDSDIKAVVINPELKGEEGELAEDWDVIE